MSKKVTIWAVAVLVLGVAVPAPGQEVPLLFERDVRPVLAKHCLACHGNGKTRANLDLRTVSAMLARRNYHPTLLGVFDQPIVATHCTGRMARRW